MSRATSPPREADGERPSLEPRYAIARLHQRIFAGVTERVAPHGLTTLQFTTLSVLSRTALRSRRRSSRGVRS